MAMFGNKPWPFGRPPYPGSKLARACRAGRRNSSPDNVGHRRGFPAEAVLPGRASARLLQRNRPMPSGKRVPTPANTEAARTYRTRDRGWLKQVNAIVVGRHLSGSLRRPRLAERPIIRRSLREQRNAVGQRKVGVYPEALECQQGNQGSPAEYGSRTDRSLRAAESLPMRRLGGGASVVVCGRESRPHGEGRQDVSIWTTEGFNNREGSR